MLKYMTKEQFMKGVDEKRFVIVAKTATKYEVYYITENHEGRHAMIRVVNPESKDGTFSMTGGNYHKGIECMERIAHYVDEHAEDKDKYNISCLKFFQSTQQFIQLNL